MKIHFIAIGGSAMHNLAIALHKKGFEVSGSDDEIFEPSRSRLDKYGLLPDEYGWFPEKITDDTDAVILGMHAREDNSELKKAREIGIKIYSYPEYIYEQTKNKKRVVVGGSHGKTTTTAMIMHVLKECGVDFDYMVGANLEGFDTMVRLTNEAEIAVFEGDEYLSSPIDRRPKFHLYYPDIAVITGIAWDHINVFPTYDNYVEQFRIFADKITDGGKLIYYSKDKDICIIVAGAKRRLDCIPYDTHLYEKRDNVIFLKYKGEDFPISIFGEHNLQNLSAAKEVCKQLGVREEDFYKAIASFKGAAKRLQLLHRTDKSAAYLDFAHSPSKLKATVEAVKAQYGERKLIACMELHTFSSLKDNFLPHYRNCMDKADVACVYFNPHVVEHKKLKSISKEQVADAFGKKGLKVFTSSSEMLDYLKTFNYNDATLLLMSSGNFDGLDMKKTAVELLE